MNRLIELDGKGCLVIQPEALAIEVYAKVWNRDKTKDKSKAIKELTFVYFSRSMDKYNPYKEYNSDERTKQIIKDLNIDWPIDKLVFDCIEQYEKHNYTFATDYLLANFDAANKIKDYLRTVDLDARDDNGKPIHKATDITKVQSDASKVLKTLKELMQIEQEGLEKKDNRIRGGGRKGMFEGNEIK